MSHLTGNVKWQVANSWNPLWYWQLPNEITVNSRGLRKTKHKKNKKRNKIKTGQETKSFRYELYKYIIQSNSQFTKATWTVENQNRAINANPNLVKSRHHKFRGTSLLSFVDFPLLFLKLKSRVLTNFGQTLWFVLNCGCGWIRTNLQKRQHFLSDAKQVNNFAGRLIIASAQQQQHSRRRKQRRVVNYF